MYIFSPNGLPDIMKKTAGRQQDKRDSPPSPFEANSQMEDRREKNGPFCQIDTRPTVLLFLFLKKSGVFFCALT